jgi:flagellar hook-length control protein FliK
VSEARLQLSPAGLGQLDIKISTDGDKAVVIFNVQHGSTREAIDLAMPRLREMLEQSGLQLAHSEVSDQSQSRHPNSSEADEAAGHAQVQAGAGDEADDPARLDYLLSVGSRNTLVDYYA